MFRRLLFLAVLAGFSPSLLAAQTSSVAVNVRGGFYVPTFDVADIADSGMGLGLGVEIPLGNRLFARANADFGTHDVSGVSDVNIKVNHYILGLGLPLVVATAESPWRISVNAGAGFMTFDVEGPSPSETYFAINVGGEVEYALSSQISLLLSPQGDIAFVDEADGFTGSTAWVWPFTAGVKIRF